MTMSTRKPCLVAVAVALGSLQLAACSSDPAQSNVDLTTGDFATVAELASASEFVVLGELVAVGKPVPASSGSGEDDGPATFAFVSVTILVEDVLASAPTPETAARGLKPGQRVEGAIAVLNEDALKDIENAAELGDSYRRIGDLPAIGSRGALFGGNRPANGVSVIEWRSFAQLDADSETMTFERGINGPLAGAEVTLASLTADASGTIGAIAMANAEPNDNPGSPGSEPSGDDVIPATTSSLPDKG